MLLQRVLPRPDFYLRAVLDGGKGGPERLLLLLLVVVGLAGRGLVLAGVLDVVLRLLGAALALDVAEEVAEWAVRYLASLRKSRCSKMFLFSSLRILWKSYMLSCLTKEEKFLCRK